MIVDCSVCHVLYNTNESFFLSNCAHVLCNKHQIESNSYNCCVKCRQPKVKFMTLKNLKIDERTHEVDVDLSDSTLLNKESNSINSFFVDITTQLEDFYGVSKFQIMNLKERCHYLANKNVELEKKTSKYEDMISRLKAQLKDFDALQDSYQLLLQKHYQRDEIEEVHDYPIKQKSIGNTTANNFLMNVKESVGLINKTHTKPDVNRYPSHNYPSSDIIHYKAKPQEVYTSELMEESSRYDHQNQLQHKKTYRNIKNSHVPSHDDGTSDRLRKVMGRENGNSYSIQPIGPEDERNVLVYPGERRLVNKSSNSRLSSGYYNSKNGSSLKLSVGRGISGRKGIFSHRKESK